MALRDKWRSAGPCRTCGQPVYIPVLARLAGVSLSTAQRWARGDGVSDRNADKLTVAAVLAVSSDAPRPVE